MTQDDCWRVWNKDPQYGEVLYRRATGLAPEMESSKAAAKHLEGVIEPGSRVLDVGCGVGHYLRSLRNRFDFPFSYVGVDSTAHYIELARKAFAHDSSASFHLGDIYSLDFEPESFHIVMCCNVLLHLPSVLVPIQQLWRLTRRFMLVRTLVGETSFRIKQVREWQDQSDEARSLEDLSQDPVFDQSGEPREYHFFNIYSSKYISWLWSTLSDIVDFEIVPDRDYNPEALGADKWPSQAKPGVITEAIAGHQLYSYILMPWAFVKTLRTGPG